MNVACFDLIALSPTYVAVTGLEASMQLSAHFFASRRSFAVCEIRQAGQRQRRTQGGSRPRGDEARARLVAARSALLSPAP